jgi:lipopolysaccharide/colanic/teichoic acid biosynthesis glycosyltransferase
MTSSALARDHLIFKEQANGLAAGTGGLIPEFAIPARASKAGLRLRMYASLILADALALALAFMSVSLARFGNLLHPTSLNVLVILLPMYLVIAFNSRAYAIDVLMTPKIGVHRSLRSFSFAVAIVIGTLFYLKSSADFSRVSMAIGTAGSIFALIGFRWTLGHHVGRRYDWRFTNELLFVDEVPVFPMRGEIVLFANAAQLHPSTNDPALLDRMGTFLKNCDRVVLACPPERRAAWAAMMKGVDVNVEIMAPELDELGALQMNRFGDKSTVLVSHGPLGLRDQILKRTFDLALAIPALIVLIPLFAVVVVAIKLDSPGPVLFRQPRTGLGNRMFHMLKFRSMRLDSLDTNASKLTAKNDPRVTRVGDFLRRTSLDELPQLINVLLGQMSIVGPRPHAVGALAGESLYWEVDHRYWHRHAAKPGITGLAQVRGFRGTTFQHVDLSNRLQADLEYLTNWSIWRDVAIVAATAKVLTHRNAF